MAAHSADAGLRVLRAAGAEFEADLSFAGLNQVLHPLFDDIEDLSPPQRTALDEVEARSLLAFCVAVGRHFLAADYSDRTRDQVLTRAVDLLLDRPSVTRRPAGPLSRRFGLLAPGRCGRGFGLVVGGPEALLRTLLGKPVARADLNPRGSGLAGGLNLGGLQFLCRFSQAPGGFESAHRPVGDVESAERSGDPLDRAFGGHQVSVVDNRRRSMIR